MQKTLLAIVAAALVTVGLSGAIATAGHEPANKVSAAGSETEVLQANESEPILEQKIRTATPEDLILQLSAECSITTELLTVGNDVAETEGTLKMYVTIDDVPVPVSQEDSDQGRVVFCNRYERRSVSASDDNDLAIDTFQRTRNANAFNWLALNVGNGVHTIKVFADFDEDTDASDGGSSLAVVGNRTLIVEPTKAANDEVVDLAGQ